MDAIINDLEYVKTLLEILRGTSSVMEADYEVSISLDEAIEALKKVILSQLPEIEAIVKEYEWEIGAIFRETLRRVTNVKLDMLSPEGLMEREDTLERLRQQETLFRNLKLVRAATDMDAFEYIERVRAVLTD